MNDEGLVKVYDVKDGVESVSKEEEGDLEENVRGQIHVMIFNDGQSILSIIYPCRGHR
jgi:hypothetical protein